MAKASGVVTQSERILRFIRDNPGCTTMDLTLGLAPFVSNPRARISDLRDAGHRIEAKRVGRGVWRYHLVTVPSQLSIDGSERLLA